MTDKIEPIMVKTTRPKMRYQDNEFLRLFKRYGADYKQVRRCFREEYGFIPKTAKREADAYRAFVEGGGKGNAGQ